MRLLYLLIPTLAVGIQTIIVRSRGLIMKRLGNVYIIKVRIASKSMSGLKLRHLVSMRTLIVAHQTNR